MAETQATLSETEILANFLFVWKKKKTINQRETEHQGMQGVFFETFPIQYSRGLLVGELPLTPNCKHSGTGLCESTNKGMNICLIHKVEAAVKITH